MSPYALAIHTLASIGIMIQGDQLAFASMPDAVYPISGPDVLACDWEEAVT